MLHFGAAVITGKALCHGVFSGAMQCPDATHFSRTLAPKISPVLLSSS